jgi:hypothetical protein
MKTLHGTEIKRYKNFCGKQMGPNIHFYRDYWFYIMTDNWFQNAERALENLDFELYRKANCVCWNRATNDVRFSYSPDFNKAREPKVGRFIIINPKGEMVRQGKSDCIWHHKWLWVKDSYNGFNVEESKQWSEKWLAALPEPAKGTRKSWNKQLKKYGLK